MSRQTALYYAGLAETKGPWVWRVDPMGQARRRPAHAMVVTDVSTVNGVIVYRIYTTRCGRCIGEWDDESRDWNPDYQKLRHAHRNDPRCRHCAVLVPDHTRLIEVE